MLMAVDTDDRSWTVEESLRELARLAGTAGLQVVGQVVQALPEQHPTSYLGKGKLRELREQKSALGFDTVVADDELSPTQQRHIEDALDVQVLDRTAIILHIFSLHARSREGRLQVELAQYRYRLPRLTGRGTELSRLGAGINTRGPGESKLETDRRRIWRRISELNRDIERVKQLRALHRRQRRTAGIPVVALAGYTNAGKSSLMNRLTGADVLSTDRLFATLDPTTRRLELPNHQHVLLTDTVGFIQKLPTDLIEAFRATLEEITEADLILHVADASSTQVDRQTESVEDELEDLGVGDRPRIMVLNKVDLVSAERLALLEGWFASSVPVSATAGTGVDRLLARIAEEISAGFVPVTVRIPYGMTQLVALFRSHGMVETEVHQPEGTRISGRLPTALIPSFQQFLA
jgi:GTP-binding protein HflX